MYATVGIDCLDSLPPSTKVVNEIQNREDSKQCWG